MQMRNKIFNLILITCLCLCSCSSSLIKTTAHKQLTTENFQELNGFYKNKEKISLKEGIVFQHFSKDTFTQDDLSIKIQTPDTRSLKVHYLTEDSVFKSLLFRGKYKHGYFKVNRKLTCTFPLGILFWGIRQESVYIGLDPQTDLLVINDHGGTAIFLIIPVGGADGEYKEIFIRK